MTPILTIEKLSIVVGNKKILDNVDLQVKAGTIMGVVGGSGSGKTTLGMAVLKLLPPAMQQTGGRILFEGREISSLDSKQMRLVRGAGIGTIFQEPLSAFDPLFTVGYQIEETLAAHDQMTAKARLARALETLQLSGVDDPRRVHASYPHQLSGGLRQRAMIAQAIVCGPKLLIADEPTSSLDVTVQARILAQLKKLNKEQGMSILLIAHDLGLITHMADEVAVMTEGKVVDSGPVEQVLQKPAHSYTKALMEAF
jgi:peptide/nickel transport system ATP-binding protein